MVAFTAILSILIFIFGICISGIVPIVKRIFTISHTSVTTIGNKNLSDNQRGKKLQQASLQLFGAFFLILIRVSLVFVLSFLPIFIVGLLDLAETKSVFAHLTQWKVIAVTTILIIVGYSVGVRCNSSSKISQIDYSFLDRLLHRVAYSSPTIQFITADIENKFFKSMFEPAQSEKPIFITSLPRAGTTIMLEALCRFPSLATYTYRDMPFVMSPLLWSKLSHNFRKENILGERAHKDGIKIGYDSPEAFEEVLWKYFWPKKYDKTNISLWKPEDVKDEATTFFLKHIKKIVTLRRPNRISNGRYISKNNSNLARLSIIKSMFPKAKILIPVRNPIEQTNSLLQQHLNFIEMHKKQPFVRKYMADIGHYEFGLLHRPIAFPGLKEFICNREPLNPDYWLGYWIAAFEYVASFRDFATIVSYEKTCAMGSSALAEICRKLEIPEEDALESASSLLNLPPTPKGNRANFDSKLISQAEDIYKKLLT